MIEVSLLIYSQFVSKVRERKKQRKAFQECFRTGSLHVWILELLIKTF